jgi:hypothetical protein
MNVRFLPEVLDYFEELAIILYEKEYFGFYETSRLYVDELVESIKTKLPTHPSKPAPAYFDKYGKNMEYAVFKKNKYTFWYVFFRVYRKNGEDIYQVRYIANNHVIAQYL